jgi:protein ERP2
MSCLRACIGALFLAAVGAGVELTFELPDNAKECFYQDIERNTSATLEFQVCILLYY